MKPASTVETKTKPVIDTRTAAKVSPCPKAKAGCRQDEDEEEVEPDRVEWAGQKVSPKRHNDPEHGLSSGRQENEPALKV